MPISDRRHGGNAQRKIFFIITPVCACYSGPCVLLMALRRTQNMEPNICRGNWSKKQCCKRLCTEKRTCSCPRPDVLSGVGLPSLQNKCFLFLNLLDWHHHHHRCRIHLGGDVWIFRKVPRAVQSGF
ncbi:hypothetical protein GOODEAATRI_002353 [Goodea atripinnis]|uniref:Uncharacterized protein n=1 Tax=Goodea atripinnis TaxID=208336 RepID=A0ABV0NK78_9TELE